MRKHSFVHGITAFSLIVTVFVYSGFLPAAVVRAENLPDLHAQRRSLEAAETENTARLDALQQEISELQNRAAELKNEIRKAPLGSLSLFREYAEYVPACIQEGHGYGTQSIQYLTEKLGGKCQFSVQNNTFILRIIL